jgi:hypothetical protein
MLVLGERRLGADEVAELLGLQRGVHRDEPVHPLGWPGGVTCSRQSGWEMRAVVIRSS